MKESNKDVAQLNVSAVNTLSGKHISNVVLELWKENIQMPEEGLTEQSGNYVFPLKVMGIHYINAKKVGYIPLVKKLNFTKGF